jgi:hypothetical protein
LAVLIVPSLRIGVGEGAAFLAFGLIGLDPGAGLLLTLIMRIKAIATSGAASLLLARRYPSARLAHRQPSDLKG